MADYIYLLQNRLTPAQWRAVEALREAARTQSMPVFLVGGAVRDLTSGSPVRDLDFAVQGEADRLVHDLEAAGAVVTGRNEVLSSLYLTFRGGVRAEVGPTLSVTYDKPGKPSAQSAAILDDLRRRDFTANAMAISLNEGSYGLLLDPLNGTADIENREFRLVSPYGFIENPALLLRAARLTNRLGWSLEEKTATRYGTSKEEDHVQALPAADRGYELEEVFHEEDPIAAMEHLAAEGWLAQLSTALKPEAADRTAIEGVRDAIGQMEGQGIFPDPSAVYFPFLTGKLPEKDKAALKAAFARPGFAKQIETVEERAKELGSQLSSKAAALPSEAWRLLRGAEPELVLWLAFHVRSGAVQTKIKAFLKDWPQMRQKLPYGLMQEMRITPDLPEYDKLLDDLFFALIDGKLDTPEATRAFLEPYSPPAPVQVSVRKRPAKAARGRAKKAAAVEEVAADPVDVSDDEDEIEEDDTEVTPRRKGVVSDDEEEEDDDVEDLGIAASVPDDADDDSLDEAPDAVSEAKPALPAVKAPAVASKPESQSPAPSPTTKAAPAKTAVKKQAAKVPVPAPKKAVAPVATGKGGHAPSPAKKAAGNKVAAGKTALKVAAGKTAPSKSAVAKKIPAKAPVKVAAKVPARKKPVAKKLPAKKLPAKKVTAQASTTARGKTAVKAAGKAAKKVAAKARGKR